MGADASLPLGLAVTKEIRLQGSFRFDEEFAIAARMIDQKRVNVRPLISQVIAMSAAVDAFTLASDRSRAMKVQLDFDAA
jgi:L-idonate 5-dehydrogenase